MARVVGTTRFKLDATAPRRKQQGEPAAAHQKFLRWCELGYPSFEVMAEELDVKLVSIQRYNRQYQWEKRRDIELQRKSKSIGSQIYGDPKRPTVKTPGVDVVEPPPQLEMDLTTWALRNASIIAPRFEIDELMKVYLRELQAWIDGENNYLLIVPPPRSGKTTAAILALVWGYLRYPTRSYIIISASGRLSALTTQRMKELFSATCPEGWGLSKDTSSKLAWQGNWSGAGLVYSASRGGALLGLTGHRILVDDLIGSTADLESPIIMEQAQRTLTTDAYSRLTPDDYGKGSGICIVSQRLGRADSVQMMVDHTRNAEREGLNPTRWRCIASPFICPTSDEKMKLLRSFPDSWDVVLPHFRGEGLPVSHRFSVEHADTLRVNMSERDFNAMYKCDVLTDNDYCAYRRHFVQEIDEEHINPTHVVFGIDMALVGDKSRGNDDSALTVLGIQDGNIVLLGLHIIETDVEKAMVQVAELADRYRATYIAVEAAGAGHALTRSLGNNLNERHFNVRSVSHRGLSKGGRLNEILGPLASKKLFARKGLSLMERLHQEGELVAMTGGKTKKHDDLFDSFMIAFYFAWNSLIKSGAGLSSVTWGDSGQSGGGTPVTWGRGTHALMKPTLKIDGTEHYKCW